MNKKFFNITISNYRSIPYNNPITLRIERGITFILGVNNIGKSNLLKFYYEFSGLPFHYGYNIEHNFNEQTNNFVRFSNGKKRSDKVINQNGENRTLKIIIKDNEGVTFNYETRKEDMSFKSLQNINYFNFKFNTNNESPLNIENLLTDLFNTSLYIGSFRNANFESKGQYYDITIGTEFIKLWDEWQNGESTFSRKKINELTTELKEIFEFEKLEIRVNRDKNNLIVENENGSFTLDELGGGISHFIIVLGNALIKEPSFILIDEPENALHPKLQNKFVRALASKAKHGLIATSHSIGLAKTVADHTYFLSKVQNNRLQLKPLEDIVMNQTIAQNISELGYTQFVDIGGNHILLVEGPSDIKVFKEILRKYGIENNFIVMDLGGSSNIHGSCNEVLEEIKRLNAQSYSVIIDSEKSSETEELQQKFKDFKSICENLGFIFFATEFHSTENYISQEALNEVFPSERYTALLKFENFKDKSIKWGKCDNWKLFREMKIEDFEGTELNNFMKELENLTLQI